MKSDSTNPYVGLRPFDVDESLLFFGRNEQTLELLQRLHQHHFVAVVGSSGSGKSSLLRAGLIPSLKAGYLVDDSDDWFIAIMKPGQSPLYNLAESILLQVNPGTDTATVTTLAQNIREEGADVLLNLLAPLRKEQNINFFLLVDQFEELFRFSMEQNDVAKKDEAIDFVNIMLELSQQSHIPFYMVITMRSDFIGDCAQFYSLPEAMNQSQYLVPRLNRIQLKTVIEGPAKLYGGKLNPSLTSRLLNELGKVKDELPLLQHALMRIWDFEMNVNKSGELDLEDYESIGGIEKALSNHADEALEGMSVDELRITKELFQALTAIDENGRKIRRPVLLSQLKKLTGVTEEQVLKIIDLFITDKRSFLVINKAGDTGDKVIDISHESLIRQWKTLSDWVDEEGESVSNYLQLAEAAKLFKQKKKDFLAGSELQIALEWRDKFKPAAVWANRYKEGFEECIDYLDASEKDWKTKQKQAKDSKQKQRYLGFVVATLLLIAVVIGIGFLSANKALKIAEQNQHEADLTAEAAKRDQKIADDAMQAANKNRDIADSLTRVALHESDKAKNDKDVAQDEKEKANLMSDAYRLHSKAIEILTANTDPTLAFKLEVEAFKRSNKKYFQQEAMKIYSNNSFYKIITSNAMDYSFSPDGKTILLTSDHDQASLLDYKGNIIKEFKNVRAASFLPGGKTILTRFSVDSAYVINFKGDTLRKFENVRDISFAQDGKILISKSYSNLAYLISLDGDTLNKFENARRSKLSPDGNTIIITSPDFSPGLINVNGDTLMKFKQSESISYSPDGKAILVRSLIDPASLINLNGDTLMKFKNYKSISFSPDGKIILIISESQDKMVSDRLEEDNSARLINLKGDTICELRDVESISYSPDGKTILAMSEKTARLLNLKGRTLQELPDMAYYYYRGQKPVFSPDGKAVLMICSDKKIRSWNLKNVPKKFEGHSGCVSSVAFSPDGKTILTGSCDSTARLWDLNGNSLKLFKVDSNIVESVAFSPDGTTILTGSDDNIACLWDLNGKKLQEFKGHISEVYSVSFSPDGKTILTSSDDTTARLWDLEGKPIVEFKGHRGAIYCAVFSPDGKTILTSSEDTTARLWDWKGHTLQVFKGHSSGVISCAFSPDGKTILTGSDDNTARLWDLKGNELQVFEGHNQNVRSVAFSPDGKTILTGSSDNTARLWDSIGNTLQIFEGHSEDINFVAFSPDGKTILTSSQDGTACLWEVPMSLEDFLKSGKIDPLSAAQKKEYGIK